MSASGMPIRRIPSAWSACSLLVLVLFFIGCESEPKESRVLLAGNLEWGTEGSRFFQECGGTDVVPLRDPEDVLEHARYFVSFYAIRTVSGALQVERINYLPPEGFQCGFDWKGVLWRATGNEPFWMAAVSEDGMTVQVAGEEPVVLPVDLDDAPVFSNGDTELVLEPFMCRDSMADNVTGWRATLTVDGSTFRGCGFQGLAEAK